MLDKIQGRYSDQIVEKANFQTARADQVYSSQVFLHKLVQTQLGLVSTKIFFDVRRADWSKVSSSTKTRARGLSSHVTDLSGTLPSNHGR